MNTLRFAALLGLAGLTACQSSTAVLEPDNFRLPSQSRYACNNGEWLGIDKKPGQISVTRADGTVVDLTAVESGSESRYSHGQVAVVFDGSNALYMDTGKPPMECKRRG
jgi:membrane-bound inhibitor of C-type lysozyme